MACVESCPQNAIKVVDELDSYNAIINEEQCVNCDLCRKVCQNNRIVKFTQPIMWKQGWARDTLVRSNSSSGGVAQAIERAFVRSGGVVCSCAFEKGLFGFVFAESEKEVEKFKGSKYVKSNPCGIYKKIKEYLIAGRRVLFVGLPCQVEAVKCYIGEKFDNGLYTVDLICHGSPSPKVLDMFLAQYDIDTKKLSDIQFRNKNNFSVREGTSYIVQKGVMDKYSISFLNSISYTENCYHCQYANIMRVSDITLGDSWGSNLDIQEQRKGVSLILNQTLKGKELLEQSELELMDVHEYLMNGGKSCMAGFVLSNTLSDNGGVTRGICKMDENGNLTEIVETKNIVKTADGAEADGVSVDVNSLVSMNMWGLTPGFLDVLENGFKEFFDKEVPSNPLKAEYLIPVFIGELLEQKKMSVKVLKTNDTWYGMTYHEDVASVKDSFRKMQENGVYKADLFSDL